MPITQRELLSQYGEVARAGNAALFAGAGLSVAAGFPSWPALLQDLRQQAEIPGTIQDLPLVAEYIVQALPGGREALEFNILSSLSSVQGRPTKGIDYIARLPINDIWTTNYDCLLEYSMPECSIVVEDNDLTKRRHLRPRRIIKMHGSLTLSTPPQWRRAPVITRQDYERYEERNPRLWAALKATYLTKSFLFLGFSFTDPNIEILLRLSRGLSSAGAPEHFTILRRPDDPDQLRAHNLRVADLENSGIAVTEIQDFDELTPFLGNLVRRTRPKLLFVSGSGSGDSEISGCSRLLGDRLAEWSIDLVSLAGPSAMRASYSLGRMLLAEERYDPERIRFYFQGSHEAPQALKERIGTAIYTSYSTEDLRSEVLSECRAAVIIGGGENSRAEVLEAQSNGVPIIPIARSRGAALEIWEEVGITGSGIELRGTQAERNDWNLLNHDDVSVAVSAAVRLIAQAMYLDGSVDRTLGASN